MARSGRGSRSGRRRGRHGCHRSMLGGRLVHIADRQSRGSVTAIDIDRALLDVARVRLAESGIANCDFVEGNAYDVDKLVSRPAELVFMANAFHGVPERTRLARAVAKRSSPHGHFAIVNWHARPREQTTILGEPRGPASELRMTPEATRAAVEPAGFRTARVVELPPYHYGAIFEKSLNRLHAADGRTACRWHSSGSPHSPVNDERSWCAADTGCRFEPGPDRRSHC